MPVSATSSSFKYDRTNVLFVKHLFGCPQDILVCTAKWVFLSQHNDYHYLKGVLLCSVILHFDFFFAGGGGGGGVLGNGGVLTLHRCDVNVVLASLGVEHWTVLFSPQWSIHKKTRVNVRKKIQHRSAHYSGVIMSALASLADKVADTVLITDHFQISTGSLVPWRVPTNWSTVTLNTARSQEHRCHRVSQSQEKGESAVVAGLPIGVWDRRCGGLMR